MLRMIKPFAVGLLVLLALPTGAEARTIRVTATLPIFADIAQAVGGEHVTVEAIALPNQDPHFVDPKPSFMLKLNRADLLVWGGLDLETGWLPPLLTGARNRKIQIGAPGNVNASTGVRLLEVPDRRLTRAEGDIHIYGNPHYYTDPANGIPIARNILAGLERVDPAHAAAYRRNAEAFIARVQAKTKEWADRMAPYRGTQVITYHKLWPYFAERFGLQILDRVEPRPGIPPSPRHLARLIARIEAEQVPVVIMAPYYNDRPVRQLARKTGVAAVTLYTQVGGAPEMATFFDLFETNLHALIAALSGTR